MFPTGVNQLADTYYQDEATIYFLNHIAHRNIVLHIEIYVFLSIVCYVTMWFQ